MLQFSQTQKQTLKIAPSQIQLLNFFHLTTLELEDYVRHELEDNPLLEESAESKDEWEDERSTKTDKNDRTQDYMDWDEFSGDDIPDYKTRINNYSDDDEFYTPQIAQQTDWRADVKEQLHLLLKTERQIFLADFIVDLLNDDGYLTYTIENIANDVSFKHNVYVKDEEIAEVVTLLKKLSPAGIGTKNLQESLAIQLKRKYDAGEGAEDEMDWAMQIVGRYFEEMTSRNYDRIMRQLKISPEQLRNVLAIIATLSPKPITEDASQSMAAKETIVPDYIVNYSNGIFEISLNNGRIPPLKVNQGFSETLGTTKDKKANQYIQSKVSAANWLIDAIRQRENTMTKTMRVIVSLQQEYFKTGELRHLKPMTLKDIADRIQMDISTVSRVTSGKYAQTPFGNINLKSLFTGGVVNEQGEEVSNREVQNLLAEIIENEDKKKPFNDSELVELLNQKGFSIARRTVAKYREQLGIENASFRKAL